MPDNNCPACQAPFDVRLHKSCQKPACSNYSGPQIRSESASSSARRRSISPPPLIFKSEVRARGGSDLVAASSSSASNGDLQIEFGTAITSTQHTGWLARTECSACGECVNCFDFKMTCCGNRLCANCVGGESAICQMDGLDLICSWCRKTVSDPSKFKGQIPDTAFNAINKTWSFIENSRRFANSSSSSSSSSHSYHAAWSGRLTCPHCSNSSMSIGEGCDVVKCVNKNCGKNFNGATPTKKTDNLEHDNKLITFYNLLRKSNEHTSYKAFLQLKNSHQDAWGSMCLDQLISTLGSIAGDSTAVENILSEIEITSPLVSCFTLLKKEFGKTK